MSPLSSHPSTGGRAGSLAARTLAVMLSLAGLTACSDNAPSSPGSAADGAAPPTVSALVTRLPKKFFVNPATGSDANSGSSTKPFKTLAKALSISIAGDTVKLGPGNYSKSANGEKFSNSTQKVMVPSGVRIEGTLSSTGGNLSALTGELGVLNVVDEVGLNLAGSAIVKNVTLLHFQTGVRGATGQQTLTHLSFTSNPRSVELKGTAKATLKNANFFIDGVAAVGVSVRDQAQFTMDGGLMTSGPNACNVQQLGVAANGTAVVTLKNQATIKNLAGFALSLHNRSKTILANAVINKINLATCAPAASVLAGDSASLRLRLNTKLSSSSGVGAVGIQYSSVGVLRIDTASVIGYTHAGVNASGKFTLVMNKGSILGNGVGINAGNVIAANANITIAGSTVASNQIGIGAPFFKLRKSTVAGNQRGVVLTSPFAVLGTVGDPGNNLIINNVLTGVTFLRVTSGVVFATGNKWNALTQGADASGHYPAGITINGASPLAHGPNFNMVNLNLAIQL